MLLIKKGIKIAYFIARKEIRIQLEKHYPENISIKEEYYYTKRILSKKREKLRKTFCQLKKI
jgi:hypothetical protein